MRSINFVVAAVAVVAASAVSAQTTTYTSLSAFTPNLLPGSYTENFIDPSFSGDPSADFSGGAFAYTVSAPGGLYGNGILIGTNAPNSVLTVTFTGAPVTAVGGNFWATDIFDVFQAVPITLTLSDGTITTFTPVSEAVDSFRGFTSAIAITSLQINSIADVYAGMGNLTVGAIPEPGTWLLMGLGLGALALRRLKSV